jgi:hypothetical protein
MSDYFTREELLAQWDAQPAHHREMCAHILLRFRNQTWEAIAEAGKQGWDATKSDLTDGVITMSLAIDLLTSKEKQ